MSDKIAPRKLDLPTRTPAFRRWWHSFIACLEVGFAVICVIQWAINHPSCFEPRLQHSLEHYGPLRQVVRNSNISEPIKPGIGCRADFSMAIRTDF